jgi:acyl-CoA thioesterase FadM
MHLSFDPSQPGAGQLARTWEAGSHLPFFSALAVASDAWGAALDRTGRDDLHIRHFAVVSVAADFGREMFHAPLEIELTVEKVGSSSVTLVSSFRQHGAPTGTVRAVLVRISPDRGTSLALSAEQREALTALQE